MQACVWSLELCRQTSCSVCKNHNQALLELPAKILSFSFLWGELVLLGWFFFSGAIFALLFLLSKLAFTPVAHCDQGGDLKSNFNLVVQRNQICMLAFFYAAYKSHLVGGQLREEVYLQTTVLNRDMQALSTIGFFFINRATLLHYFWGVGEKMFWLCHVTSGSAQWCSARTEGALFNITLLSFSLSYN